MKIKINGDGINPNNWKVFFDDKEVKNLIKIKFDVQANQSPVVSFDLYPDSVEIDLDNIELHSTSEKEIKNKIEKLFLETLKG